jgi:hypothetical protein
MRTVAAPRPDAPPVTSALEPLIFMNSPKFLPLICTDYTDLKTELRINPVLISVIIVHQW